MENNELYHWGVKGMRWGQRRYQNKDGTLTPAGKKRYAKEVEKLKAEEKVLRNRERTKASIEKLEAKRKDLEDRKQALDGSTEKTKTARTTKSEDSTSKSTVKDLSDQDLQRIVNRLNLEQRYAQLNPPTVSKGKKFVSHVWDKILVPSITEATKDVAKDKFKDFMSKEVTSIIDKSKKK